MKTSSSNTNAENFDQQPKIPVDTLQDQLLDAYSVLREVSSNHPTAEQLEAMFHPEVIADTKELATNLVEKNVVDPETGQETSYFGIDVKDAEGNVLETRRISPFEGIGLKDVGKLFAEPEKLAEDKARFVGAEAIAAEQKQSAAAEAAGKAAEAAEAAKAAKAQVATTAAGKVVPPKAKVAGATTTSTTTTTTSATSTATAVPPTAKPAARTIRMRPNPTGPSSNGTGSRDDSRRPGTSSRERAPRSRAAELGDEVLDAMSPAELRRHLINAAKKLGEDEEVERTAAEAATAEAEMVEKYGRVVTPEEKATIDAHEDQITEGLELRQTHYAQLQQRKDLMTRMHGEEKYAERFADNPNVDPDKWLAMQQSAQPEDLSQDGTLSDVRLEGVYDHLRQHGHINEDSLRKMFALQDGTPLSESAAAKLVQQLQDSGVIEDKIDARGGYESTDPYIRINQSSRYAESFKKSETPRKRSMAAYAPQTRSAYEISKMLTSYDEQMPEFKPGMTEEDVKAVKAARSAMREAHNRVILAEELQGMRLSDYTEKPHMTKAERAKQRKLSHKPELRSKEQFAALGIDVADVESHEPTRKRLSRASKFMGKIVLAGNRRIKANMAPGLAEQNTNGETLTDEILGNDK